MILNSFNELNFTYDLNGMRTSKGSTSYLYNGTQLLREINGSNTIWYLYDQSGIVGFTLNDVSYYYVRNYLGDVTKVIDTSGNVVVEYTYDSWGKLLSTTGSLATTVGALNPIRYRGYYYDTETSLYYLQSRYYDPEVGRFISQDELVYLDLGNVNGLNLYCYCQNDPINFTDEAGNIPQWLGTTLKIVAGVTIIVGCVAASVMTGGIASAIFAGAAVGAGLGAFSAGVATAINDGTIDDFANSFLVSTMTGAISGGVAASPIGIGGQIATNAFLGASNYAFTEILSGNKPVIEDTLVNAGFGALSGAFGGKGWLTDDVAYMYASHVGRNAFKQITHIARDFSLFRMVFPAGIISGGLGGAYGKIH